MFGVVAAVCGAVPEVSSLAPARVLKEYALVSAFAREKYPDPKNWRVLGSNDGGQTWTELDVRTNQVFHARSERRIYHVANQQAYNVYRLVVEDTATVHLAEWELSGPFVGVTNDAEVQVIASASKEHPLLGGACQAFDGDPSSRWIDFGSGQNTCWLQCQYALQSPTLLTNVAQLVVVTRRLAAGNPLGERAPQILASFTNQAARPIRRLSGYALTSANDVPARDPRDWRLLGSNDRGNSWQTLDIRRNEVFAQRFQRRVFYLTNDAAYARYRLAIDCVRVPADLPGGATCVQLAEIEPLYSTADPGGSFSMLVCAQGENPPSEAAENAFDTKSRTKWLSFTEDGNTNRSNWLEWEYLLGGEPAVVNLRWVKALLVQRPAPIELDLEGIIVSWDATSQRLGFLDDSGSQIFHLRSLRSEVQPGSHVRLKGRLELGQDPPLVFEPQLTRLEPLSPPQQLSIGQPWTNEQNFCWGELEGRVTSVSEDSAGWTTLGLTSEHGPERMQAKIPAYFQKVKFFPGCRLGLEGVIQAAADERGAQVPGAIWIGNLDQVKFLALTDRDWSEWPIYSPNRLQQTNSSVGLGAPVRFLGTVRQKNSESLLLAGNTTNVVRVYIRAADAFAVGSAVEAIGFFAREKGTPTLHLAQLRTAPALRSQPAESPVPATEEDQTIAQIHEVRERLDKQPGKAFGVRLRGIITYIDLAYDSFYLQDATDGIAVVNQLDAGLAPLVRQEGSYVEVRGQVDPELHAIVPAGFVTVLAKGRMPEARRRSWDYLITGNDEARWVQIEGVVSAWGDAGMTLIVTGGRVAVVVNDLDKRVGERLLGSLIRVSGVCEAIRDNRNRRTGVRLMVPYYECLEILRPAPEDPFDQPTRKIAELDKQWSGGTNLTVRLVKTSGVVTYKEPRLLFMQDGTEGLRVLLRTETNVRTGDRVEAVGFVEPDGFSPKLAQAVVRKVGTDSLPLADSIDLMGPDVSDDDGVRVQIEATLLGQKPGKFLQVLELNDTLSDKTFSAFIPVTADALPAMRAGSRLHLTGVFRSETETMADLGQVPTSFQLYVDAPQDIAVLNRPPWWTVRHTLWVSATLATVLLMALSWARSLRQQVLQRTEQLHAEIAEHKSTEDALESSERFLRSLLESLPQNILRKDLSGRFIFANEFFCRTIGKPMDQVLGKTDFDLFPPELAAKFRNDDQEVMGNGKPLETVEQNRNGSGESIFVQVVKTPLFDAAGQVMGIQIIFWDVTERKHAEARLEEAQRAMVDASRQAGMAEVAAGVLHNVGNVLNSVNVSASLVSDRIYKSKVSGLAKAVGLLREHETDLPGFFAHDRRAQQLTAYLGKLAECLTSEQAAAMQELQTLKNNIEHIKEIVTMQQSYAKIVGLSEKVKVTDLVEDALRLHSGTLAQHEVELTRDYEAQVPEIVVERHKVLQILVNLIRNAKNACDESGRRDKRLVVRVTAANGCVHICTSDNGVGIAQENLTRIFNHGFTTRKDGHGFGLHSGALAAKEMGGTLVAQSDGPGKGASFTLSLPLTQGSPLHSEPPHGSCTC